LLRIVMVEVADEGGGGFGAAAFDGAGRLTGAGGLAGAGGWAVPSAALVAAAIAGGAVAW